jgi:hypothetical protein
MCYPITRQKQAEGIIGPGNRWYVDAAPETGQRDRRARVATGTAQPIAAVARTARSYTIPRSRTQQAARPTAGAHPVRERPIFMHRATDRCGRARGALVQACEAL